MSELTPIKDHAKRTAEQDDRNGTKTACPYEHGSAEAGQWHHEYFVTLVKLRTEGAAR